MKYKRYNLVGVVEDVFEDRDIVWPDNVECSEKEEMRNNKEEDIIYYGLGGF